MEFKFDSEEKGMELLTNYITSQMAINPDLTVKGLLDQLNGLIESKEFSTVLTRKVFGMNFQLHNLGEIYIKKDNDNIKNIGENFDYNIIIESEKLNNYSNIGFKIEDNYITMYFEE